MLQDVAAAGCIGLAAYHLGGHPSLTESVSDIRGGFDIHGECDTQLAGGVALIMDDDVSHDFAGLGRLC